MAPLRESIKTTTENRAPIMSSVLTLPVAVLVLLSLLIVGGSAASEQLRHHPESNKPNTFRNDGAISFQHEQTTAITASRLSLFTADVVLPSSIHQNKSRRYLSNRQPELRCFVQQDETLACAFEDTPRPGLTMVFFQCPPSSDTLLECDTCRVYEATTVEQLSSASTSLPTCTSCDICVEKSSVAYDCSNQDPEERCSKVDCNANCLNEDELVDVGDFEPVGESGAGRNAMVTRSLVVLAGVVLAIAV